MPESAGNLFTSVNIEEITRTLQVDLGADDHDVFQAKITAMQRLLRHGMSKFSKDKLYQHLCIVARRVLVQERMRSWDKQKQLVLPSVCRLKEVVSDLHGKDKFNGLLESERQAIRYFQNFFVDIDHLRTFKETYDKEIHTVLYYDYYQSGEQTTSFSAVVNPADEDSGNYSLSELDEKNDQTKALKVPRGNNSPGQDGGSRRGGISPRNKCDDSLSHVGFSFSKHLDGSEVEKLNVTVKELSDLSERWDRLLLEDEQDLEDYEPESYYEVMECAEHTKFEAVFRLIPDTFAKCYKIIELSKQWWNLAHIIYKDLPLGRPVTRSWPRRQVRSDRSQGEDQSQNCEEGKEDKEEEIASSDKGEECLAEERIEKPESRDLIQISAPQREQKEDRIKSIKAQLFDLSFAISNLVEELTQFKINLRQLDSRERRFQMLEILHGKVYANLEEIQEKCRKLRAQRKVTAQKYSYTFRGTEKYFDYREKLRRIDKKLMTYDQDLQLLVYKQSVVDQDYMLEMEIRPNFIRSYDDLRANIIETEFLLKERQQIKNGLEEELELLEPDGIARRNRKSENGSSCGQSDVSRFRRTPQSQTNCQSEIGDLKSLSRNSGDSMFQEVFSGLGRRYELVNSAPPVKTQLKDCKKAEPSRIPKPVPPRIESTHKRVTTIDGSKLGFQDKSKFQSPRPPPAVKRRTRKQISNVGRRIVKPIV